MGNFDEGMKAFNHKDYHTAVHRFILATEEDDSDHKSWNALGVTFAKIGSYEDADTCFRRAIALSSGNEVYIKNHLSNKANLTVKKSYTLIFMTGFNQVITELKNFKKNTVLLSSLFCLVIYAVILLVNSFFPVRDDSFFRQILAIVGIMTGVCFILILYGQKCKNELLSRSGPVFLIISVCGLILLGYFLMNPSSFQPLPMNTGLQNETKRGVDLPATRQQTRIPSPVPSPGMMLSSKNNSISFIINDYDPFNVTFSENSTANIEPVMFRFWDFGDGSNTTEERPTHVYAGQPKKYLIHCTVQPVLGGPVTIRAELDPDCDTLHPDFSSSAMSEEFPLPVLFTDNSSPQQPILSWRWFFGDGNSYYTMDPEKRNISHYYHDTGTYYVTLMVENGCHQVFTGNSVIVVEKPVSISGIVWIDQNMNGVRDPVESNLTNQELYLDEKTSTGWEMRKATYSDMYGTYRFNISASGGTFRVREKESDNSWMRTNPYNVETGNVSRPFSLCNTKTITGIDFGQVKRNASSYHDVFLQTSRSGVIFSGGFQSWQMLGDGGAIVLNGKQYPLTSADNGMITVLSDINKGKIVVIGDQHEYSGINVSASINGVALNSTGNVTITLPAYSGYLSTLHLTLDPIKDGYVNFVWDGVSIPVNWRQRLDLFQLMPTSDPRMELNASSDGIVFTGRATGYSLAD